MIRREEQHRPQTFGPPINVGHEDIRFGPPRELPPPTPAELKRITDTILRVRGQIDTRKPGAPGVIHC